MRPSQLGSVADLQLASPDLDTDPETQLVHAHVMAGLFGDEPDVPTIGRYPIFARVGQGAMGVVYACYDAQLDRRIAVKVLRADIESEAVRARMVREAQAMAKLSHPNVAHVYEVGEHEGRTFVAMELVKGQTLREWWTAKPRRWQDVLAVGVAAGRGLAAAHDKGLTHRDFKPDNVMIGDDDRVRVMDFGLVRIESQSTLPDHVEGVRADDARIELTRSGSLVGTPAYMAPEQLRDTDAGPTADQFAFCVTLWEALFGQRPFVGKTFPELADNLRAGRIAEPPAAASVPKWLRRALARGLRVDPSERYASMPELLAALDRGTGRARTRRILAALGVLALAGVAAEGTRRLDRARAIAGCEEAGASIDGVWNDDVRTRVHDAFVATDVSYAATAAEKVMPWIDAQADAWRGARTDACLDADVNAVWSADVLDRSLWCLDERRMELEALVAELSEADAAAVQKAVGAAAQLAAVDACRDAAQLERLPAPPTNRRDEIQSARMELAQAGALQRMGEYGEGLVIAKAVHEHAVELEWPPLVAAAGAREARLLEFQGAYADAEATASIAYFEAARVGAWDVAANAATHLSFIVGNRLNRHAEGIVWSSHARVALDHTGDGEGLREAGRLGALASVQFAAGVHSEARALHERALAIRESALGSEHPDVAVTLGNIAHAHQIVGEYAEAKVLVERALAIKVSSLGPEHPDVAVSLDNLASVHHATGDTQRARELYVEALEILRRAHGEDHPDVGRTMNNLGSAALAAGDLPEARRLLEEALRIREKTLGPDHPDVAVSLDNLASVHHATGDTQRARELYVEALEILRRAHGEEHPDVGRTMNNLGSAALAAGDLPEARRLLEEALRIREKTLGPDHPEVAQNVHNLASVLRSSGDSAGAIPFYERTLERLERTLGAEHSDVAACLDSLAAAHLGVGAYAKARALSERALAINEKTFGVDHIDVARSLANVGAARAEQGEPEAGARLLQRALAIYERHDGVQENEAWTRESLERARAKSRT